MKLVYIAGLAHSGSTVLNLSLAGHPKLIGLAEVHWLTLLDREHLEDESRQRCTCGQRAGECAFWGPVFERLLAQPELDPLGRYRIIFEQFEQHFGPEAVLVDSSKGFEPLKRLQTFPELDVRVLFILRDVRGFALSHRKALAQEIKMKRLRPITGNAAVDSWIYGNSIKRPTYLFWKWYLRNRSYERNLAASGLPVLPVSYEQFALQPEPELQRICDFLGVDYNPDMLVPSAGESHNFMGNPMMFFDDKKAAIRYDNEWAARHDWALAYALFPNIARYNARKVYPAAK